MLLSNLNNVGYKVYAVLIMGCLYLARWHLCFDLCGGQTFHFSVPKS